MTRNKKPPFLKCCVCHSKTQAREELIADMSWQFEGSDYDFVCHRCFSALLEIVTPSDILCFVRRTYLEGHVVTQYFVSQHYYELLRDNPKYHALVEGRSAEDVADRLYGEGVALNDQ